MSSQLILRQLTFCDFCKWKHHNSGDNMGLDFYQNFKYILNSSSNYGFFFCLTRMIIWALKIKRYCSKRSRLWQPSENMILIRWNLKGVSRGGSRITFCRGHFHKF